MNTVDKLDYYKNMTPGKYWKLPKNKRDRINEFLNSEKYIPMIKYDGYWARIIIEEDGILIQSRGISKVTGTFGEYQEKVPHIVEELKNVAPGTVLLGELHYPDLTKTIQDVGTILRCKPPKAIKRQESEEKKLMLSLFDILAYNYIDYEQEPFAIRLTMLNNVFGYFDMNYIEVAEYKNPGEGEALLGKVWENGGEGIILLHEDYPYNKGGAKAWHSIKVKRQMEDLEAPVVSTIDPEEFYKGADPSTWKYWGVYSHESNELEMKMMIPMGGKEKAYERAAVLLKDHYIEPISKFFYYEWKKGIIINYNGNNIRITSGITEADGEYLATEEAQQLIEDQDLYAVFTGMEITEDSVRHPRVIRLRDDVNVKNES